MPRGVSGKLWALADMVRVADEWEREETAKARPGRSAKLAKNILDDATELAIIGGRAETIIVVMVSGVVQADDHSITHFITFTGDNRPYSHVTTNNYEPDPLLFPS
jgi:hypothetical protein